MKIVSLSAHEQHGTGLIASDDSVWISVSPRWWDLATWLWWWLCPSDRKAWVILSTDSGRVRTRAIRVARTHVRIRNIPTSFSEVRS